jgi:hypothetical protein
MTCDKFYKKKNTKKREEKRGGHDLHKFQKSVPWYIFCIKSLTREPLRNVAIHIVVFGTNIYINIYICTKNQIYILKMT